MAVIFCDSATGNDSDDGSTWALAKATLQAAITAAGNGGTVYLADTHSESYNAATQPLDLPDATAEPVIIISSDVLTGTSVEYKKPTAAQYSTVGNYDILFDGNACFVGVWLKVGDDFNFVVTTDEQQVFTDCTLEYSAGSSCITTGSDSELFFNFCTFVVGDTGNVSSSLIATPTDSLVEINYPTFSGTLTYRTGNIVTTNGNATVHLLGGDYSGFTAITKIVSRDARWNAVRADSIKMASGVLVADAVVVNNIFSTDCWRCDSTNFGIASTNWIGETLSSTTYTRDSGASDGDRFSLKVVTSAICVPGRAYYTPWLPVWISSTGSKTFTVYIANASADLTDTQCWLEVEYLATAGSTVESRLTDRNTDILAAGTAQTDDTSSDWDSDLTYMQSLAVTATIGKAGLARCRVGFAKASATVYVDPLVTVS